ncbi:MAG: AcrR family transcriptional regulator [Phenylobacterium sp.]
MWGTILWLPVWLYDVEQNDRENAFEQWLNVIKFGLVNTESKVKAPDLAQGYKFKSFTFDEVLMAPAGFDKKQQNRKKQQAFFRAGTIFFNQKGFKGTSLDELAQSLGVTKGAFYYHIKNKDDLLAKCFERTLKIEQTVLEQAAELGSTGIEKLAYCAQRLFDIQVGEQGPLIRYATMWSFSPEKRAEMEIETRKIRALFGELIKQGVEDNSIKQSNLLVAENVIAGAIESIPDMNFAMDGQIVSEDAAEFYHIFFNGIAR